MSRHAPRRPGPRLPSFPCLLVLCVLARAAVAAEPSPPERVALQSDQTLEDLASTLFDDPAAADELRALNGLAPGAQPPVGQPLHLPGADRAPAIAALRVSEQALQVARGEGSEQFAPERHRLVVASHEKATAACRRAAYAECQQLADETWALARLARQEIQLKRPSKNRFAVSIDKAGTTRVEVTAGDGVKVTGHRKSSTIHRGESVQVQSGGTPEAARPLPEPPEPSLPFPNSTLVTTAILFQWQPVDGAVRYVLLISRDERGSRPVRQLTVDKTSYLLRASLPDGDYFWFLRTVDSQGAVGRTSEPRAFRLRAASGAGVTVEQPADGSDAKGH